MSLRFSYEGNALFIYRDDEVDKIEVEVGSIYKGKLSLYDGVSVTKKELLCIAVFMQGEGSD